MMGPRHRHIHDAPLSGVLERLLVGRDQRQERVIDDLRREPRAAAVCVQQDNMVRFQPLGGMDGLEVDFQPQKTAPQTLHVRFVETVASEEQCRRGPFLWRYGRGQGSKNLVEFSLIFAPRNGNDFDCRFGWPAPIGWSQRNLTAQAVLLVEKGRASWTDDDRAAWDAGEAIWLQIKAIRGASDRIKAMPEIPQDYAQDQYWG